ncbi:unnamed protein product [Paramecium octaurelia]|uniref:Uncharacterized protein n=1 Tax=Paramecium octaurelia TaxID=43137 RepID=A0A8S1Y461_PAROT|nr:unnamed protein product [Paramecium octaurelia]
MKLKNEAEEPNRIDIFQKEQIIEELKDKFQMKNQLSQQVERNNAIQIEKQKELEQLKEKLETNLGIDKLSQDKLLKDKEQQQFQITQKDDTIKELRFKNEQFQITRIERTNIQILQQENDGLESALSNIRLTMKVNNSTNVKNDGATIKDQAFIDLQNRLNEYIKLFEDEKNQKNKLSQK